MSIKSMSSNHLILCHPLLLPSIFPSIRVFTNESALLIRWPKYWTFSFNISPSNEYPGLISFRRDWLDLLANPRNSQESSPTPQFKSCNWRLSLHPIRACGDRMAFDVVSDWGMGDRSLNFHMSYWPWAALWEGLKTVLGGCVNACSVTPTVYNHVNCSLSGSSVHGIFKERILEQVASSSFRGSWPGIEPVSLASPELADIFLTTEEGRGMVFSTYRHVDNLLHDSS